MALSRDELLGKWLASPEIDGFFQWVEFREDGTGAVQSAGGHALCLSVDFRWELQEGGRVAIDFQETERMPWPRYAPTEALRSHQVCCELEIGEFPLRVPAVTGTVTYRRRLHFDESPLPKDAAKYHEQSLFFSVVNQIDPRQFLVFYARAEAADVVPDPRPAPVHWRDALLHARHLEFGRFPGRANEAFERTRWIRVVADGRFLLEACVLGGGPTPIERVVWCLPGTTIEIGELAYADDALVVSVGGRVVGQVSHLDECIELLAPDSKLVAREAPGALWCSRFDRPGGLTLATRSAPFPTVEHHFSNVELNGDCSDLDRLLLIAACIVALERDTAKRGTCSPL